MEIPKGHWVKVYDRSGVGGDTPLTVVAGVIDEDYRGEVMIIMVNESEYPYDVEAGMKIAQFAFHEKPQIELVEAQELSETVRGEKGFGSTDAQTT